MAMLKRMAYPNTSASVPPGGVGGGTTAAAARGKRKVRGVGHVYENSGGGGGGGGSVYARNLLHKLERKVRKRRKHGTPQAGVGVGVAGVREGEVVVRVWPAWWERKGKLLHSVLGFSAFCVAPHSR
ncbi:unnamed protein product [Ectocarpus sp. 4 AP-2014]